MVRHTGEDFIEIECVTKATMLSLQSAGIKCSEFDAPEADRFSADSDASFSQKIFEIAVTQIEPVVEPDGVADDIGWESVSFISAHSPILSKSAS